MEEQKFIDVLWVEDQVTLHKAYQEEAAGHGLLLTPYTSWEEALKALNEDYEKWSAIILDAKCKFKKDDVDKADKFLVRVQTELFSMYEANKRVIPYFVLSAGTADMGDLDSLIFKEKMIWDASWPKSYYSKNLDRETLYDRIVVKHKESYITQVKTVLYPAVFSTIEDLKLDTLVADHLADLLVPISFPKLMDNNYIDKLYKCRKIMEGIFRSMISNGLLPETMLKSGSKSEVNLSHSSLILAGNYGKNKVPNVEVIGDPVFTPIISENVKNLIFNIGAHLHTQEDNNNWVRNTTKYFKYVKSTYLLQAMALHLCDLILYYKSYMDEHPDLDERKSHWNLTEQRTY